MTALLFALAHEALNILVELTGYTVLGIAVAIGLVKGIDRLRPVKIRRPS